MITEDSLAQGNVPDNVVCKSINEVQCAEEVISYRNNTITVITKQSARELHDDLPQSCLEFHLESLQSSFISWERSDARVSKEIFKCKVLTASASQRFSATKGERDESKRMLIHFEDVIGLEVRENSIVMDVKSRPKFEKKFHTKDRENGKTGGGKWMEENMHVEEGSSPNRIELVMVGRREPVTAKLFREIRKRRTLAESKTKDRRSEDGRYCSKAIEELGTIFHHATTLQVRMNKL